MIKINSISRLTRTLLGATMFVAALGVSQQAAAAAATTGVTVTKHNLGTNGTGTNHLTVGTAEICVFCHTPHASNVNVAAPLWNKGVSPGAYTTYSTSNSSTLDGEVLAVGSISLACLSCHDGAQAMDNMVNAPGSDGYTAGGASPAGYTWTGANQTAGKMSGLPATLGKDLTNDHPIGIRYCGGGQIQGTPGGGCTDPDFVAPSYATINSQVVFWVETGANATRSKTDMILYNRTFTSTPAGVGPSVECGSCHDPHNSTNNTFLRLNNDNSAVCLSCHVK